MKRPRVRRQELRHGLAVSRYEDRPKRAQRTPSHHRLRAVALRRPLSHCSIDQRGREVCDLAQMLRNEIASSIRRRGHRTCRMRHRRRSDRDRQRFRLRFRSAELRRSRHALGPWSMLHSGGAWTSTVAGTTCHRSASPRRRRSSSIAARASSRRTRAAPSAAIRSGSRGCSSTQRTRARVTLGSETAEADVRCC